MERLTIQVGGFEVNCSILSENGKALVVDPGQEADRIVGMLSERNLDPVAVLLTHAHFDHIGAVPGLLKAFPDLPVYIHEKDLPVITHPINQFPPEYPAMARHKNFTALPATNPLLIPPFELQVIETPGHTPGGVCYYFPTAEPQPLLLSGDTLFASSIGRTDLPGGDMATLMDSLKKLTALPDDTLVVPGHGSQTTIAAEKRGNPFLR